MKGCCIDLLLDGLLVEVVVFGCCVVWLLWLFKKLEVVVCCEVLWLLGWLLVEIFVFDLGLLKKLIRFFLVWVGMNIVEEFVEVFV